MKKMLIIFVLSGLITAGALAQSSNDQPLSPIYRFSMNFNPDRLLQAVIPPPPGFDRLPASQLNLFSAWIVNLPLESENHPVVRWDNQILMPADSVAGIIDLGIATKNQKNADLPLQILIEYLLMKGKLHDCPFILENGDTLTYRKWLSGKISTDARGNLIMKDTISRDDSEREFYRFLEFIMVRTEHRSLVDNLFEIDEDEVKPGDLYVQLNHDDTANGGHAAIIFDVARGREDDDDRKFLVGWGGDPAQSLVVARPWPVEKRFWFSPDELRRRLDGYGDGRFYRFNYFRK